mmetsp:Transcript_12310/g.33838  ORF Transcript_12310/g.33838 Transcript_12310/m.33838 type:complete len:234 (+) Transcript_12310:275-976(+)|eukprot:CAMPEP_0198114240 /NCGR_PEP_ID=MMETSP1442-20131203/5682_1 /TAXON_ID= /ORGANISM="Craspedostauros australis, Strain CCMP3328" /LENGTH=233 /DNA_ID=CAMNT_0043771513 /DNA_START=230 /DNA_END=931 /DNA_ORIENTATION=+
MLIAGVRLPCLPSEILPRDLADAVADHQPPLIGLIRGRQSDALLRQLARRVAAHEHCSVHIAGLLQPGVLVDIDVPLVAGELVPLHCVAGLAEQDAVHLVEGSVVALAQTVLLACFVGLRSGGSQADGMQADKDRPRLHQRKQTSHEVIQKVLVAALGRPLREHSVEIVHVGLRDASCQEFSMESILQPPMAQVHGSDHAFPPVVDVVFVLKDQIVTEHLRHRLASKHNLDTP